MGEECNYNQIGLAVCVCVCLESPSCLGICVYVWDSLEAGLGVARLAMTTTEDSPARLLVKSILLRTL